MTPEARREQLLGIAARHFSAEPYDLVSLDNLAKDAGVSLRLLYHYFPTKRELFIAVLQRGSLDIVDRSAPDTELRPAQRLRASIDAYLSYATDHPHSYRAMFRSADSNDPRVREVIEASLDRQAARILHGSLRRDDPVARVVVRGWLRFMISVCLDCLDQPVMTTDQVRELCAGVLESVLRSLPQEPAAR